MSASDVTRVVRTGFIAYAIGSLIAAAAPTLTIFVAARVVQGASNAFLTPLLLATLAEIVPPQHLTRAVGTFASIQTGALSLAPLIGGLLATLHWRLAFVASAAVAVALAIFTARTSGAPAPRRQRPSIRSLLTRRLGFLCMAAFLGYATVAGVGYMVSFYARDRMGLGPLERGVVLACFGAAGFVLGRPLGAAVQQHRPHSVGHHRRRLLGSLRRAARIQHDALAARGAVDARRRRLRAALDRVSTRSRSRPCRRTAAARRACSAPSASPAARSRPTSSCRSTTTSPSRAFVACAARGQRDRAARDRDPRAHVGAGAAPAVSFGAMSDCIFCGIAAGTMPAERVHSDERTVAFLDIFPACDGHVLVIPRAHADDIHTRPIRPTSPPCARTAQLHGRSHQRRRSAATGVTILQANGAASRGRRSSTTTSTSSRASTATAPVLRPGGRPLAPRGAADEQLMEPLLS